MSGRKTCMVITSDRDGFGRVSFTLFWSEPDGVFRQEPSSKGAGAPVGYRRAQCFRAVPEDYIARGAVVVTSESDAIALAWGIP